VNRTEYISLNVTCLDLQKGRHQADMLVIKHKKVSYLCCVTSISLMLTFQRSDHVTFNDV